MLCAAAPDEIAAEPPPFRQSYCLPEAARVSLAPLNRLVELLPLLFRGLYRGQLISGEPFEARIRPPLKYSSRAGKKYRDNLLNSFVLRNNFAGLYPLQWIEKAKQFLFHRYVGAGKFFWHPTRWWHLALREPATSRPVDGRYGGHRWHNNS